MKDRSNEDYNSSSNHSSTPLAPGSQSQRQPHPVFPAQPLLPSTRTPVTLMPTPNIGATRYAYRGVQSDEDLENDISASTSNEHDISNLSNDNDNDTSNEDSPFTAPRAAFASSHGTSRSLGGSGSGLSAGLGSASGARAGLVSTTTERMAGMAIDDSGRGGDRGLSRGVDRGAGLGADRGTPVGGDVPLTRPRSASSPLGMQPGRVLSGDATRAQMGLHNDVSTHAPLNPDANSNINTHPNRGFNSNSNLDTNAHLNINPNSNQRGLTGTITPTNPFSPAVSRNASPSPGPGGVFSPGFATGDRRGSGIFNPSTSASASALKSGDSALSLSINYLPNKFSSGALNTLASGGGYNGGGGYSSGGGARRRAGARKSRNLDPNNGNGNMKGRVGGMPKMGGGSGAFRSGANRIGGLGEYEDDDDDEGEVGDGRGGGLLKRWGYGGRGWGGGNGKAGKTRGKKLRWNKFKWVLFIANIVFTTYSIACLITCLLFWLDIPTHADIIRTGNHTELSVSTVASVLGVLTAMVGFAGLMLNHRPFLAVYTALLWVVFIFMLVPGYMTYKKRTFNLEGKINAEWSRALGMQGRLIVQNSLQCCGYFSPFIEATISQTCYSRSVLPGCKGPYIRFEREALGRWYGVVFGLVPVHVGVMVAALLCANHVTYRFGKGMMPERYRLSEGTVGVIMDKYAEQLAEQYGDNVAHSMIARRTPTPLNAHSNANLLANQYGRGERESSSSGYDLGYSDGEYTGGPGYNNAPYNTAYKPATEYPAGYNNNEAYNYTYNAISPAVSGMSTPTGGLEVLGYERGTGAVYERGAGPAGYERGGGAEAPDAGERRGRRGER